MLKQALRYTVILVIPVLLFGCTGLNLGWMLQSYDDLQAAEIKRARMEVDALLAEKDAIGALELMRKSEFPPAQFADRYPRSINQLITQAAEYFIAGDFAASGERYRQVLDNYPAHKPLHAKIDVSRDDVMARLDRCADTLLEAGLIAYRNGQLQEAIDVWSQIRHFHPEYRASTQAIQTTRKQLKSLEQFNNPG